MVFCSCLKDCSNSRCISGKNLCLKYLKHHSDQDKLIERRKIVKQANPSSICDSILNRNTKFEKMHIFFRNYKFVIFLFFLSPNFSNYSHSHLKGTFLSEEEAKNRSLELGCEGIHKNQDKWLPCKNEKELHIYLRK